MVAQAGLVLRHKLTGDLRFFYPGNQTMIFDRPVRIISPTDFRNVLKNYNESQFYENLVNAFPGSEWIFFCVVNVRVFITIAEFM